MRNYSIIFLLLVYAVGCRDAQKSSDKTFFSEEKARVLEKAEEYMDLKPITVTATISERSTSGIHDFYSEGDYWWPDSKNPDGPYIRKDGMTNPDNFTAHREARKTFILSLWRTGPWERRLSRALEIAGCRFLQSRGRS